MSPSRILGKIRIEVAVINRNRIEIIPYWIEVKRYFMVREQITMIFLTEEELGLELA